MKFADWFFEENSQIDFKSFSKDGKIIVHIDNRPYEYITDAALHPKWMRMIRFSPWKVLNQIKSLVKKGYAQQLNVNPLLKLRAFKKQKNDCPSCGTPSPNYIQGVECPGCGFAD